LTSLSPSTSPLPLNHSHPISQLGYHALRQRRDVDGGPRERLASQPGEVEQAVNQLAAQLRAVADHRQEPLALIVEPGDVVLPQRSEEHTSELQSHLNLVCRLL